MPGDDAEATLQERAFAVFGAKSQMRALAEEACELAAAIMRYENGKSGLDEVFEEIIGVRSVAESLDPWLRQNLRGHTFAIEHCQQLKLQRIVDRAETAATRCAKEATDAR